MEWGGPQRPATPSNRSATFASPGRRAEGCVPPATIRVPVRAQSCHCWPSVAGRPGPRWLCPRTPLFPPPPYPRSLQAVKIEAKASCPLLRLSAGPEGRGWEGPLGPGSCRSLLAPSVEDTGGRWACLPQKSWGDASPSRLRGSRWGQQAWKDWGRFNQEAARFCGWRCSLWGAPRSVLPESWQTLQRRAGRAGV